MGQNPISNMSGRSFGDPLQNLPHRVASLGRTYPDGYVALRHRHPRLQLMYATSGLMMADTETAKWAIPEGHALIVPPNTDHQTRMIGDVKLRSLYITPNTLESETEQSCCIVSVSSLLAALIERLCLLNNPSPSTPQAYHLSQLIIMELGDAPVSPLALPLPNHAGLRRVCETLFEVPSLSKGIDQWAMEIGMSRRAFTRSFQRQTGLSFGVWRQRLRCQIALQAFARGEAAEKVATDVGYASHYALRDMMRKFL